MKTMARILMTATLAGGALTACDRAPPSPRPTSVTAKAPVASAEADERYPATLAQGIDFRRDGYPDFLVSVTGMSGKEPFGRWSDGTQIAFDFRRPLPDRIRVHFKAAAFPSNAGKPFIVSVGTQQKEFRVASTSLSAMEDIVVEFEMTNGAKSLVIVPPNPQSPKELGTSQDARRLAIALRELRID